MTDPVTARRVLVVDDHPLYREGLVTALSMVDGVEVVGEAGDGAEAVELARRLAPDVVVMDLNLPTVGGIEATRRITAELPGTAVLVLTMLEGDDALFAAMRAGARGYLLKGADRQEIARALATVANGEVVFSATLAARVLAWFGRDGGRVAAPFPELTDRELEVLRLVAQGLNNREIAKQLFISENTVKNHVRNILEKLHLHSRMEAVVYAVREKLLEIK